MAKNYLVLHIGPDVVEIDAPARERLAAAGILTPDVTQDDLRRADLEIRRAHKGADLKRKDVEGAWAKVCRKTFKLKSDSFISEPGFFEADDDQAALAMDGLAGLKVHLVVHGEAPESWAKLVKDGRIHALEADLSPTAFADELARIALVAERARLEKSLLKIKSRRKKVREQLAA